MRTLVLSLGLLLGTALAGSLGYGFVGFQGGLQGGGGGFGTFQGIAIGGEAWGGPSGSGGGYALPLGFSGGGGYLRVLFGGGGL
jgi:hypothetical protein